jgi:hypothetical protein
VKSEVGRVRGVVGRLADGHGGVVDQPDEADIAEDFPVVPDDKMSDDCPDHSRQEQAAGIKQKRKGKLGEEEVQNDADPADYFDQGNGANDAWAKVGHPTHTFGEHIDGLQKTNGPTESEDENENDLSGWLKIGHSEE